MHMTALDGTHDPALRSWLASANAPHADFPIQNLPFGIFRRRGSGEPFRGGVALGDSIVDIAAAADAGLFAGDALAAAALCRQPTLNALMGAGRAAARALRHALSEALRAGAPALARDPGLGDRMLVAMADADLALPAQIGDYTDFYASIRHATNVGSMFRPDNPLLPNYKWVPIGYHGRSSSIVLSGTEIHRPAGQTREGAEGAPSFGPSKRLDYEVEMGAFVGRGNALGAPVPIGEAEEHLFGLCLLNDWSARDVQTWEYQPLGPFLAKNFTTTISPWVVTLDALAPFRAPAFARGADEPAPLPYLSSQSDTNSGGIDVTLELWLSSAAMRGAGIEPQHVSTGSFTEMYWTVAQLLAHHTSNGCNLRPGDLLGSGTVSGATRESRGSMLEVTWRGTEPLMLPTGERRAFLEDGDEVIIRGHCAREGRARIGFGECRGRIVGA